MTTDTKELIELAAKAIGYPVCGGHFENNWWIYTNSSGKPPNDSTWTEVWSPDKDSDDSRSLQVALDIAVIPYPIYGLPKHSVIAKQYSVDFRRRENPTEVIERFCDHPSKEAAYNMAVLRCAAEIQRRKENDYQTRS